MGRKFTVCVWECTLSPEPLTSSDCVKEKIGELEKKFNKLKKACRECLEKCKITVRRVTDALTDLPADDVDEHKQFLTSHLKILYRANDTDELIGMLSFNMDYLSYQLMDYITDEFKLGIKNDMETYKKDLEQFRKKTPLTLFCRTQKRHVTPPADFKEVVAKFEWPKDRDDMTLEVMEQFRQKYACHYKLRDFAMILAETRQNCFIITWFIPQSIVEILKANVPRALLKEYNVIRLEIAGSCVYRLRTKPHQVNPNILQMFTHIHALNRCPLSHQPAVIQLQHAQTQLNQGIRMYVADRSCV